MPCWCFLMFSDSWLIFGHSPCVFGLVVRLWMRLLLFFVVLLWLLLVFGDGLGHFSHLSVVVVLYCSVLSDKVVVS
jgi:hypothetical protein